MKTPEEIKKALDCCNQFRSGGHWNICSKCPCDIGIGRCDGTLETDALAYIQQLEAQVPRWISVEERLPEDNKTVFVVCKDGFTTMMLFRDGDWCWYGNTDDSITHWMPLPQPPKEEKE